MHTFLLPMQLLLNMDGIHRLIYMDSIHRLIYKDGFTISTPLILLSRWFEKAHVGELVLDREPRWHWGPIQHEAQAEEDLIEQVIDVSGWCTAALLTFTKITQAPPTPLCLFLKDSMGWGQGSLNTPGHLNIELSSLWTYLHTCSLPACLLLPAYLPSASCVA